ncbi:hypothetical protein [Cetobacterium sp.]|uniref:hypothetical protein n=1 Tax=Cetobacterium sp. TaxID=2071632 RepID=UPI003F395E60
MAVIEFIFYNTVEIVIVGIIIILIGLLLRQIEDSFKLGSLLGIIGGFCLLSLIMFYVVCSKEFTIMKILEQKPNLKKEELIKFDEMFLEDVLNELREKKLKEIQEKKEKEIQKIINS